MRNIFSNDKLVFTDTSFLRPRGEFYGEFRQYCEPQHISTVAMEMRYYLETRTSGITIVFVMLFLFFLALFWFYSAIFQDTVTISSIVSNLF